MNLVLWLRKGECSNVNRCLFFVVGLQATVTLAKELCLDFQPVIVLDL